jgi:hypothetical protein
LGWDGILSSARGESVLKHFIKITFIYVYLSILHVIIKINNVCIINKYIFMHIKINFF